MEEANAGFLRREIGVGIAPRIHAALLALGKHHVLIDDLALQLGNAGAVVEGTVFELRFGERFRGLWTYYLAYCEGGFLAGATDVGIYTLALRR